MAGSSIGSLFVQLGFQADKTKLNDFIKSIGELDMRSIVAGLGLKGIQETIEKIMDSASGAAKDMNNFGKATGLSTQKMQQFGNFAEQMGVSSDEAMSSVKGLQDNLTKLEMGEGNMRPFNIMRVSALDDVWTTMNQIRESILDPTLTDAMKKTLIQEMGLSEGMMTVMKASDAQWASIKYQMIMTEKQIAGVTRYNAAMAKFGQSWTMVMQDVATQLAPVLENVTKFVTMFSDAIHKSETLRTILSWVIPIAAAIALAFAPIPATFALLISGSVLLAKHWEKIAGFISTVWKYGKMINPLWAAADIAYKMSANKINSEINPVTPSVGSGYSQSSSNQNNNVTFNITGADSKDIAKKIGENLWYKNLGDAQFQDPAYT